MTPYLPLLWLVSSLALASTPAAQPLEPDPGPSACLHKADDLHAKTLSAEELARLMTTAFGLGPADKRVVLLVDLPDTGGAVEPHWASRLQLAHDWAKKLKGQMPTRDILLVLYKPLGTDNGDLPETVWIQPLDPEMPKSCGEVAGAKAISLRDLLKDTQIVIGLNEYSTTAPLKKLAKELGFRAASMPHFNSDMVPALRLDYGEVGRRCDILKGWLDNAIDADILFEVTDKDGKEKREYRMLFDLRMRTATASAGNLRTPGTAANLPSGETFIVPYEGEQGGYPSRTRGYLPVQFGDDVVVYKVEKNKAVAVVSVNAASQREQSHLLREAAYGNMAELGFGVLSEMGIAPLSDSDTNRLLNEKLGLHIAFGRSDHFEGGTVGVAQFSSPRAVVHIDRLYVPGVQTRVVAKSVVLTLKAGGGTKLLMRDGRYEIDLFK